MTFSWPGSLVSWLAAMYGRLRQWARELWVAQIIKAGSILVVVVNAIFGVLEKKDEAVRWLGWYKCHVLTQSLVSQISICKNVHVFRDELHL